MGGLGDDTLSGGGDADRPYGGTGDDQLYGDAGLDTKLSAPGSDPAGRIMLKSYETRVLLHS